MAIGARPSAVFGMVIASGMRLVLLGAALGLAGALALGKVFEGFLFGVGSADLATLAAVAAVLTLVGFAACALPAKRALGIDPLAALREE
jgi:ABC-type antimicrobial peptide transport system permease subunit